jgi:hypothetical protein
LGHRKNERSHTHDCQTRRRHDQRSAVTTRAATPCEQFVDVEPNGRMCV